MRDGGATDADFTLGRTALLEITQAETVGEPRGSVVESDGVISVYFEATMPGYPGWRWTVSIAHLADSEPSVLETELTPGDGALLAPDWIPWVDRLAEYRASQEAAGSDGAGSGGVGSDGSESDDSDASDDDAGDDGDDDDIDDDIDDIDDDDDDNLLHAGDLDGVDIDDDTGDDDIDDDDIDDDDAVDDDTDSDTEGTARI